MELSGSSVKIKCRNGLAASGGSGRNGVKPIKSCSKRDGIPSPRNDVSQPVLTKAFEHRIDVPGKMQS